MSNNEYPYLSLEEREKICRGGISIKSPGCSMSGFFAVGLKFFIVLFAITGFGFMSVYLAVNLHLTNTEGIVDNQNEAFWSTANVQAQAITSLSNNDVFFNKENFCILKSLKGDYPGTFWRIIDLALSNKKELAQKNLEVASKNFNTTYGDFTPCLDSTKSDVSQKDFEILADRIDNKNLFLFASSTEWSFFKNGVVKDKEVIARIEKETGIKSRIIVSQLVAEQMRLFYSDRVWFEKAISPVKVLASMSQFSWGVLGIKQETAARVELNLKAKDSVFYPGPEYENYLDFTSSDITQERFKRITNSKDHYYGYLYAALFNKQIISQWSKAGFDISNRPEILATIYNIGFVHSKPHANPEMGGAELNLDGNRYSFGRLAYEFYYSGELLDEFPQ